MPSQAVDDNKRMNLRIAPEAKSKLMRAATILNTDLTNFVTQSALREAEAIIEADEKIRVSQQDYQRILELLENPPKPNAKLQSALSRLPSSL